MSLKEMLDLSEDWKKSNIEHDSGRRSYLLEELKDNNFVQDFISSIGAEGRDKDELIL